MKKEDSPRILEFMASCYSARGMEQLVKTAHQYFENACALFDSTYRSLYRFGGEELSDPVWDGVVSVGQYPLDLLSFYVQSGMMTQNFRMLYPCFEPRLFDVDRPKYVPKLAVAIPGSSGEPIAWFVIFQSVRPITEADHELLSWFSKILLPQVELFLSNKSYRPGMIGSLMLDILNEDTNDLQSVNRHLESLHWRFDKWNRILTVKPKTDCVPRPMRDYLVQLLEQHHFRVESFIYNGYLVLVVCSNSDLFITETIHTFSDVFKRFDLYAGISSSFRTIQEFKRHHTEALNCLKLGRILDPAKRLFLFEDYMTDLLIFEAGQYLDLSEYCHPYLFALQKYDQQNKTEYLKTLHSYVKNYGNLNLSAQELHIHRNTMSYRIEKIQELLGVETFDQKLFAVLYMSFIVFDIMNLGKSTSLDS